MPTLTSLRRSFSRDRLYKYRQATAGVQASPPSGSYAGVADTADAQRMFVSTDLGSTSITDGEDLRTDFYDNWFGWLLSATPEQRRVSMGGYTANNVATDVTDQVSTAIAGVLLMDRGWGAVVPATTVLELHPHPILDYDMPGIHSLLNRALGTMRFTRTLEIAVTGASRLLSLAAYPVTKQSQLGQVRGPAATDEDALLSIIDGCRIVFRSEVPYLLLPWAVSGGNLYVDMYFPRSTWIKVSGTWAASTVGLVSETDECTGKLEEITLVAYYHYCRMMAFADPRGPSSSWLAKAQAAASEAAPFLVWDQDQIVDPREQMGYGWPDSQSFVDGRGYGFGGGFGGGWP